MSSNNYFFCFLSEKHLTFLVLLLFVYQGDLLETNLYRVLYFASITSLPYQKFYNSKCCFERKSGFFIKS